MRSKRQKSDKSKIRSIVFAECYIKSRNSKMLLWMDCGFRTGTMAWGLTSGRMCCQKSITAQPKQSLSELFFCPPKSSSTHRPSHSALQTQFEHHHVEGSQRSRQIDRQRWGPTNGYCHAYKNSVLRARSHVSRLLLLLRGLDCQYI